MRELCKLAVYILTTYIKGMGIKYKINESFFNIWSPTMSYVLGFIYADGNIHPSARGKYLVITSTDKEIIYKIKKWLNSEHKITTGRSAWPNSRMCYIIKIGNKFIYNALLGLGIYPNKSLTIRMPIIPKKYLKDFVRGYFDGDGCVYLERAKGIKQPLIIKKLSIIFTSGSKKFLEDLLKILRKNLILIQNKIYISHRSFQLRFNTKDTLKIFDFMYKDADKNLYFKRKFYIFRQYFYLKNGAVAK